MAGELAAATEAYIGGDATANESLARSLRGIVELYPSHIWKEDYLLFPMTNKILSPGEQQDLLDRFEAVEASMGSGVHQRFEQLAAQLTLT